ncbi:MAG: NAD(P)-dependent alcohol dehydrogenase, partial [Rhodoglobus sp.]
SYTQAAALSDGGLTALPFLRDTGSVKAGQSVLVNGASGAVGSAAVQLARHLGATVTAVTSGPNLALVRQLGAHHVIDYTVDDFTKSAERWDVVFDAVGSSTFGRARRVLTPRGIYLATVPGAVLVQSLFTRRAAIAFTGLRSDAAKRPDLAELARLTAEGHLTPLHDSSFPMTEIARAHARVDSKRKRGTVVLLPPS